MNYDINTGFYPTIILDSDFFIAEKNKINYDNLFGFTYFLSEKLGLDILIFVKNKRLKKLLYKAIEKCELPLHIICWDEYYLDAYSQLPSIKFYTKDPNIHATYRQSILCDSLEDIKNHELARVNLDRAKNNI